MAEDEESMNKPITGDQQKLDNVTGLGATSPSLVVDSDTALPAPEVGPPVEESEVALDSSQQAGVGDADVGASMGESESTQQGNGDAEEVEAVRVTVNEAVTEENATALEKDEVTEASLVRDEVTEENVMALEKDEVTGVVLEKDEMAEALEVTNEAESCMPEGTGDEKVVMTTKGTENDEILAGNDNIEGTENGETVTEVNDSTVEGSVGLGKNGEMEEVKCEEVGITPVVLDDSGGITLEKEAEAMETDNKTANAEENDMVSHVDIAAVEARVESEKDVEMDTIKHEEVEYPPLDEEDKGAARIESEKDVEMDTMKHEEEESVPLDEEDERKKLEEEESVPLDMEDEGTKHEEEESVPLDEEDEGMKHEEEESVPLDEEDEGTGAEDEAANATPTEIESESEMTESGKSSGGKRKRKNTKSTGKSKSGGRASSRKTIGEDVCFICFDGGDLVLCDRRGCTKAYHPSCIDRDEEFFRAKGRWNCGWHQCTICQKNACYLCYTCTFSLCKGCIKDDVILCVRGNKGFCKNCMRMVKLIEGLGKEENDGPIDFDDKSSFEYLFKDYLMDLKAKLSLSSDEIADAKSPRKGADVSASKQELSQAQRDNNDDGGSGSDASIDTLEARRGCHNYAVTISEGFSTAGTTEWASKELLEFVKHMKSGDTSVLSQFDVQALLLEYIKTNKLRDPRRKSQIICDSRLERLFGKARVGHFEMLKLLESHFLMKEDSQIDDVQGSVVDTEFNQFEADANADTPTKGVKDRKRKRKKGENRGPQSNLDEYAAIDVHNISLIYLRRKLVEDLLEENDKFHEKVVGTFLRIRISGNVQKQDLYRLVQVVGTSKAAEPYKLGKRTTDIQLEILNLNKTEVLSIDTISNQDFTEEECKRLRQSIRCGLINRPTVGDILDKAMEIHAARVNEWLEAEISRLSHLRDRAKKLQLLKTPDERHRRLEEVPEIHADPKMDPSYESEDEDSESNDRRDAFMRSRDSSLNRRGRGPVSPRSNFSPKDSWGAAGKFSSKNFELNRSSSGKNVLSRSEDGVHSGGGLNEDNMD
ncbi:hypothetical protein H5410_057650 [Solanum commersonii]|uniref:Zinc finger CCCH domain-containing protein 19 n=1 Tax=Solanum commersonii TaxID=4109 RepID=A0A9J5WQT2_SOLCO|nr:hypothetical protein H5410_057650 [Solanum commersonii]